MSQIVMYALVHTNCGHYGGLATHEQLVADQVRLLRAAGYHRWECDPVTAEEAVVVTGVIASGERAGCTICRIDPLRGLLPEALRVAAEIDPLLVIRR